MSNRITNLPPDQVAIRAKCFRLAGTFVEFPIEDVETAVPVRFEKVARRYPHRIAVKSKSEQLTYSELNLAANRIAQTMLARYGETPEAIGLLLPKSARFVVAMLAILKAGKIAVPLDPALPAARLSLMFEDMQGRLLVTDHESFALANRLAGPDGTFNIDELEANRAEENPYLLLSADALACIFYTSGSTGLPKGVIENHRNLLHLTMRDTNDYHICAEDKVTFVASSGRDIFRAILNGATVYPMDIREEGFTGFGRMLMEEGITIYNSVTSAFRTFAGALAGHERFPHLRLIMVTGETVYKSDFELYRRHFADDGCVFVNRYGPNEAGGLISQYLMDESTVIARSAVPVGYAATGKEIQLLDDSGNPVDTGQPGEIVVASRYLSPGYWRQPERTRTVFRTTGLNDLMRVYHTGDIGMMEPDGCLVHLGRKDDQVKIRGNKVDMGAVEAALLNLESVSEAAVVALEDDAGNKRLVAYVVSRHVSPPTAPELRDALAASHPDYMVPSTFVFLDKLPVIGIGKVDRRSLTDPGKSRPELTSLYVAPRNPIEAKLAGIWSDVLALQEVGVVDGFFDLGGHSLAAMRVVSEVVRQFQLEIPLKSLFESPTVAQMAKIIEEHQEKGITDAELDRLLTDIEALQEEDAVRIVNKTPRETS